VTLGSLFDGIGGFPLAATRFGIKPIWASEIEAAPISITKRHFPEMKHLGDITKVNGAEIEPVDIITFGSPCQDLSVAGKRAGMEGERSGLFMDAIRIIKEMRERTNGRYPTRIIWENVTGAFSSNNGEDFRTVIEEIAKIAEAVSIPKLYKNKWLTAGAVVGNSWSLAWRVLDAQYWGVPHRRDRIFIIADFRKKCAAEILFKPESLFRYYTKGRKNGDSFASHLEKNIRVSSERPNIENQYAVDFGRTADRIQINAEKAVTLQGEGGGGGAKTGLYCLPIVLNDQGGSIINIEKGDISPCLRSESHGNLPIVFSNTANTLRAGAGAPKHETDILGRLALTSKDKDNFAVRRLTPLECERLQGFPDEWTAYGYDGIPISDNKRYKALGNSVAIPCIERLLKGILEVNNE